MDRSRPCTEQAWSSRAGSGRGSREPLPSGEGEETKLEEMARVTQDEILGSVLTSEALRAALPKRNRLNSDSSRERAAS